jgi:hypothetical protein
MTSHRHLSLRRVGVLAALLSLLVVSAAGAATITIFNNDGVGEGFNDVTPKAPGGGNPGTTIGAQRLYLFQYAAGIWGGILPSTVPIIVTSQFNPQFCNATSATLGSAGPINIVRDFPGAEFPGTWYHVAEGNRLAGVDLIPANNDINATFNSNLDLPTCLGGIGWYYGTDGLEGAAVELLPVLLHEMGHGLGFSTPTSGTTGNFNTGFPGIFDRYLYGNATGLHWYQMTAAQRVASAISVNQLSWDGPGAITEAAAFLANRSQMIINSPGGIAGTYVANNAAFGPQTFNVTGNVVLVTDAGGLNPNDACDAITNAAAIAGNIALVDRGNCTFVIKAGAIQAAGATAILIANNAAGPLSPGGADPTITIPVVGISQADGATIKANLGGGVNLTINQHPTLKAGADGSGRPLMYAPNPFQGGSSVSHYDVTLLPNALMEPAINNDLHDQVDLTHGAFQDIGWFGHPTATTLAMFTAEGRGDGVLVRWRFGDLSDVGAVTLQRSPGLDGPWAPISVDLTMVGETANALDRGAEPNVNYYYRLSVMSRSGEVENVGLAMGSRRGLVTGDLFLGVPTPNPMQEGTSFSFRLSHPEFVRISIVDATGRTVRVLQNAMMPAGEFTRFWDGRSEAAGRVAPGVYFINLRTSEGIRNQRVAVMN